MLFAERRVTPKPRCASKQSSTVIVVPGDVPFAELPDRIELSLDEVSAALEVLDIAEAAARTDDERAAAREAIHIVTSKLWPELGDLLDRDDE